MDQRISSDVIRPEEQEVICFI